MPIPKVSIIMTTYNRVDLITRAIESVCAQTLRNWELIVIDDASTDNTEEILSEWRKKDRRIKVFRNARNNYPNISYNLNKAIELAKSDYIARLDDDDWWCDPDKLKMQTEFLNTNPNYVVCGGGMIVVNSQGEELFRYFKPEKDEDIRKSAFFSNPFSHTTAVFSAKAARQVGGYGNWIFAEDWDFWLKLGKLGKFYNFPKYFTIYTMSDGNKSFVYQRPQSKMILKIIKTHRINYPQFYLGYCFNLGQYLYSFLPLVLRKMLHPALSYLKRSFF